MLFLPCCVVLMLQQCGLALVDIVMWSINILRLNF